jgi:hypothetical protein
MTQFPPIPPPGRGGNDVSSPLCPAVVKDGRLTCADCDCNVWTDRAGDLVCADGNHYVLPPESWLPGPGS